MASTKPSPTIAENSLVVERLQQISNSLAYLVVHTSDLKNKNDKDIIAVLTSLGFDRNVIATVLQTTPESVSVQLSQMKSASKSKKVSTKSSEPSTD